MVESMLWGKSAALGGQSPSFCFLYVRAEARTLQGKKDVPQGLEARTLQGRLLCCFQGSLPCGYVKGVHEALVAGIPGLKARPHGTPGQAGAPFAFFL
jgi:hypothetical protein